MIQGATRGQGGVDLVGHLFSRNENEQVVELPARGVGSRGFHAQLREIVARSAHSRTDRPVLHLHVDPPTEWTDAQYSRHLELYEAEFDLVDQPRLAVFHRKHGRGHRHYIYSLVRRDGRIVDLAHDFARREKISRILEYEFDEPHVPGKHNRAVAEALRREGRHDVAASMVSSGLLDAVRPVARMTPAERHQANRTKVDLQEIGRSVLVAWGASHDGPSFQDQLEQRGFDIAIGDKVPVVVDRTGNVHPLARILGKAAMAEAAIGIRAAEVRQRLVGLDLAPVALRRRKRALPDVVAELQGTGTLPPDAPLDALVNAAADLVATAAQECALGAECAMPTDECALEEVADILDDASAEMVTRVTPESDPTLPWALNPNSGENAALAVAEIVDEVGRSGPVICVNSGMANAAAAAMHETIAEAASTMAAYDALGVEVSEELDAASIPAAVERFDAPDHVPSPWRTLGGSQNRMPAASKQVQSLPHAGRAHGTPVPKVPETQREESNDVGEDGKRGPPSKLNLGKGSNDPTRARDIRAEKQNEPRRCIPGDAYQHSTHSGANRPDGRACVGRADDGPAARSAHASRADRADPSESSFAHKSRRRHPPAPSPTAPRGRRRQCTGRGIPAPAGGRESAVGDTVVGWTHDGGISRIGAGIQRCLKRFGQWLRTGRAKPRPGRQDSNVTVGPAAPRVLPPIAVSGEYCDPAKPTQSHVPSWSATIRLDDFGRSAPAPRYAGALPETFLSPRPVAMPGTVPAAETGASDNQEPLPDDSPAP